MPNQLTQLEASNKALWEEVKAVRAENDRLRAELAEYRAESNHTWTVIRAGRDVAEAAIARVRELCQPTGAPRLVNARLILRALDGAE